MLCLVEGGKPGFLGDFDSTLEAGQRCALGCFWGVWTVFMILNFRGPALLSFSSVLRVHVVEMAIFDVMPAHLIADAGDRGGLLGETLATLLRGDTGGYAGD